MSFQLTIPEPELGLIVSYVYLWHFERSLGRDEGRKDRPCVVISVEATRRGLEVIVLPITHRVPSLGYGVEIPTAVKRHLGLDAAPSWIVLDEGNTFSWAGFDLRPIPATGSVSYGFMPPKLFRHVLDAYLAFRQDARAKIVSRD